MAETGFDNKPKKYDGTVGQAVVNTAPIESTHYEDGLTDTEQKDGGREQQAIVITVPTQQETYQLTEQDVIRIIQEWFGEGAGAGGIVVKVNNIDSTGIASGYVIVSNGTGGAEWKQPFVVRETRTDNVVRAYANDGAGHDTPIAIKHDVAEALSIVRRNADGEVVVATPTEDNQATTKKYVDDLIESVGSLNYKGTVATVDDLDDIVDPQPKDTYFCEENYKQYTWNGEEWVITGEQQDLAPIQEQINKIINGQIVVAKSQVAEGLSTDVGTLDKTPFAYMTSGGQTDVETGYQRNLKLVGSTIVKNQLANISNNTTTNYSIQVVSGYITITNIGGGNRYASLGTINWVNGHLYLFNLEKISNNITGDGSYLTGAGFNAIAIDKSSIAQCSNASSNTFGFVFGTSSLANDTYSAYIRVVDLTQMFGSNDVVNAIIGNDTSKQVANLMLFLGGWLPTTYDTGTLIPSKSAYLKSVMYNQWDEEWELGYYDRNTGGKDSGGGDYFRSKNYIRVEPNTTYYLKHPDTYTSFNVLVYDINKKLINGYFASSYQTTVITPINAAYITFFANGTTYNHDICIFIYWDGSKITYEPYEQKIEPLPNIEINGILKVDGSGKVYADGDELYPDGTGKRRYGVVNLGTLNYTLDSRYANKQYYATMPSGMKNSSNMLCPRYIVSTANSWSDNVDKTIQVVGGEYILIVDNDYSDATSFKTSLSGVYLIYELETETDITSTSFNENIFADDFGTLQFLDENNAEIVGLQGCEIFYKANVSGFAESLYVRADGNPNDYVVQSELSEYVKQVDLSSGITNNVLSGSSGAEIKVIKTGKVITISGRPTNSSGSTITAGTRLFTLPNGTYNTFGNHRINAILGGSNCSITIGATGDVSCSGDIINGDYLHLALCYVVA